MTTYKIAQDVNLTMLVSVEADSAEEAVEKVRGAWANSDNYVKEYLYSAVVIDEEIYDMSDDMYAQATPLDEML